MKIKDITIGDRFRKELGNIDALLPKEQELALERELVGASGKLPEGGLDDLSIEFHGREPLPSLEASRGRTLGLSSSREGAPGSRLTKGR